MGNGVYDLAVVGCGGVSRMHLDGYTAHPERVRVVALCDPDGSNLRDKQKKYAVEAGYTSVDDLVREARFDVAVVCTPTVVREPVIRQLAEAGKHVFAEKPLADSYGEAEGIVSACEAAGVTLGVDQNFRCFYAFNVARQVIQGGRLGTVLSVVHRDLMFRQDSGWRIGCERHALSVMGVHWLDGFRWMLNSDAAAVTAHTYSSPAIDCAGETDAVVQIGFENGTAVSYVESFSSPIREGGTVVIGEEGTMHFVYDRLWVYTKAGGREPVEEIENPVFVQGKPESPFHLLNEMLTALDLGQEPGNSGQDNLKTIALLEAVYRSAAEGKTVLLKGGRLV